MLTRSTPGTGDIIVRQEAREGTLVHVLHTVPGPEQCLVCSREEAVAQALTFAKRARVRAWFANGDTDFVLLGEFLVPAKSQNESGSAVPAGVVLERRSSENDS